MRSLRHLLDAPLDTASEVARRWTAASRIDGVFRWGEFRGHVSALRDRLAGTFRDVESEAGLDDRPEMLQETRKGDTLERWCRVPSNLACLPGHFPDFPVVPGVLQVDWAMRLATDLLGAEPHVEEFESLKFRAPLRPGDHFRIRVRAAPGDRIEFKLWSHDAEYARGRVRVATEGQDP